MNEDGLYIGLISGTSVDGVDCALVRFEGDNPSLVATHFVPTPAELRKAILALCTGSNVDLREYGHTDVAIGKYFADATNALIEKAGVDKKEIVAIGSHGQTVFHEPGGDLPFTLQLGDPNTIAQQTGITSVADIRRRDMAVGGEGAPLAPLLHRNCFSSSEADRVILNVGGISNITVLMRSGDCFAFDTGPGNVLMDYWIGKHESKEFDAGGSWAALGSVVDELLDRLLHENYFDKPAPKSTGRELFNEQWLTEKLQGFDCDPVDVQATLLELTASTVASDITKNLETGEVYVCGGGAQNDALMQRLSDLLPNCQVGTTELLGVHPDWVEATAFAWIAKQTCAGNTIDTSALTGASQPVILGGIYQA